jgi:hypothetical protein
MLKARQTRYIRGIPRRRPRPPRPRHRPLVPCPLCARPSESSEVREDVDLGVDVDLEELTSGLLDPKEGN